MGALEDIAEAIIGRDNALRCPDAAARRDSALRCPDAAAWRQQRKNSCARYD